MNVLLYGITENNYIRGVERYTIELARHLTKVSNNINIVLIKAPWQTYYDELANCGVIVENINFIRNTKLIRHLFAAFGFKYYITKYNIDIVHYTNTLPVLFKYKAKSIMTIHDVAECYVPEKYSKMQTMYRKAMLPISLKRLDYIITDSIHSKDTIIAKHPFCRNKISYIYLGVEHFTRKRLDNKTHTIINSSKYILYWSVLEKSKGAIEAITAYKSIKHLLNDTKLFLIGKKGNAFDQVNELISNDKDIIHIDYVHDDTLIQYIKNAELILFPSHYEGFGFPPLEAFMYNNKIIASSTTSLGEISKDFATLVNPNSIDDISNNILKVMANPGKCNDDLREKIQNKFSWKNTANETFNLYLKIYNKK